MSLVQAIITGGVGGIAVPFAVGGAGTPMAALVAAMAIHGPGGTSIPWSWPVFCLVTLATWGLLHFARE